MKLYHATLTENLESIKEDGLIPNATSALPSIGCEDDQINRVGVFGFVDIESALTFASYNDGKWSIVSFDSTGYNTEIDPEYNGEAIFVETGDNISILEAEH